MRIGVASVLAVVLLIGTYAAAYFAILTPTTLIRAGGQCAPIYHFDSEFTSTFFQPAFLADQMIRPDRWSPGAPPAGITEIDIRSSR